MPTLFLSHNGTKIIIIIKTKKKKALVLHGTRGKTGTVD